MNTGPRRERIGFPYVEVGRAHRDAYLVRDAVPADVAEGRGQTPGDRRMAAPEEAGQQIRRVAHKGERRPRIHRGPQEVPRRARHQTGWQTECPNPVQLHDVPGVGHRRADFQQGRAVEQRRDPVTPAGRSDQKLLRHGLVAGMKRDRLLRRDAPRPAVAGVQVLGAEAPERPVPRSAVAGPPIRRAGDVPTLHDPQQESVPDETLPVRPREIRRADRDHTALLKGSQDIQGTGQFLRRWRHSLRAPVSLLRRADFRSSCRRAVAQDSRGFRRTPVRRRAFASSTSPQ